MSTVTDAQREELFGFLLETAKQTKELVQGEAPEVFREIVTYGCITSGIGLAVSIVGLVLVGFAVRKVYKTIQKDRSSGNTDGENFWGVACGAFSLFAGVGSVVGLIVNSMEFATA
jgi:hypothetical protein